MQAPKPPVFVDKESIASVDNVYRNNPTVSSAVNSFLKLLTREEFVVEGVTESKKYNFKKANNLPEGYVDIDLIPVLNDIVLHYILYGFAVVRAAPSQNFPRTPALVVVPLKDITIKISWNQFYQRFYTAYANAGSNSEEIPTSYVSVVNHPDDQGRPQSALALCVPRLVFADTLWDYYMESTFKRINPQYVLAQDEVGTRPASSSGMESSSLSIELLATDGNGSAGSEQVYGNALLREKHTFDRNAKVVTDQIEKAKASVRLRTMVTQEEVYNGSLNQMRRDLGGTPLVIKRLEEKPTISKAPLFLPVGARLDNPPEVIPPSEFVEIQTHIANEVFRALGFLPPGTSGDTKFASNISYINDNLVTVLRMFARETEPQLSRCVNIVLEPSLIDMVFDELVVKPFDPEISRLRVDFHTKEALQYSRDPQPEHSHTDESVAVDVSVLEKIPRKPPSMRVSVQYGHNPVMDAETALNLRDTHVISQEAYQEIMLKNMNLPESMRETKSLEYFIKMEAETVAEAKEKFKPKPVGSSTQSKKPKKKQRTK